MHIEIGIIDQARLVAANAGAIALVATQLPAMVKNPLNIPKAVLAGLVFTVLMQIWHQPVGPSELHLIGATSIYLLFGFAPAMIGLALGLVFQSVVFEPQDIVHLGVNALTLMTPMVALHYTFGKRLFAGAMKERFTLGKVLRIDAVYYAGVSAMVGFWLMISGGGLTVATWATWAVAYMPVFAAEALLTFTVVMIVRRWQDSKPVQTLTNVGDLRFA